MKNWKAWIPLIGVFFIEKREKSGWESIQWVYQIILLLILFSTQSKAQSFTQVVHYPYVVTSLKYDSVGNEYVLRQQGSLTKNGDTIVVLPVHYQNECGAIDFDFTTEGFVFQLSGQDSTQKIISYDTFLNVFDTLLSVPYKNPFTTTHRGGSVVYADSVIYCSFGYGLNLNDAQDLSNYRGKLVRINLQDTTVDIFGYGLRNPYRFSLEGNYLYIADVGWNSFEEVDLINTTIDSLDNFGWPCYEADLELFDTCGVTTLPIYQYPHSGPQSIIGGCFYNGSWYWTDHYTGLGGRIDHSGNNTSVDTFPQYVTSMAIYPITKTLRMSTWGGWIYEMVDMPLGIGEEDSSYVNWDSIRQQKNYEIWLKEMISEYGDIYFDVMGKRYMEPPTIDGVYYSLWRGRWMLIFEKRIIYATERA